MDGSDKSDLRKEVVVESSKIVAREILEAIRPTLEETTFISIAAAAGRLDMNSQSAERFLADYIVEFGNRTKRISLANFRRAVEARSSKIEAARCRASKSSGFHL